MSAEAHSAYLEYTESNVSWIGRIPASWRVCRVKDFAQLLSGFPFDSKQFDPFEGVPLIRIRDISSSRTEVRVRGEVPKESLVYDGDVLIGMDGDFNVAWWNAGEAALNQRVACLRADRPSLQRFLYYALPFSMRIVNDLTYFTTVKHLSNTDILKTRFAMPSAEEIVSIAKFLDYETAKIDALIEKQQQLIALLKEKRQAVISHAVTKGLNPDAPMRDSGVEWLGQIPEHWATAKLGYRYEVLLGKMLDARKVSGDHLGRYLRNTDVQWDRINEQNLPEMDFRPHERERYSVRKGDLIVCEGGEIGRCAIWTRDYACFYQKALHRLRPRNPAEDVPRFMFYHLFLAVTQERFVAGSEKATIAHLPAESFRQYRFTYAPFAEQQAIADELDVMTKKFDELEAKALEQMELLQERRTALISAAVTGKIDVRGWKVPETKSEAEAV